MQSFLNAVIAMPVINNSKSLRNSGIAKNQNELDVLNKMVVNSNTKEVYSLSGTFLNDMKEFKLFDCRKLEASIDSFKCD